MPALGRRFVLAPVALALLLAIPVGTVKASGSARVIWEKETEYQYARVVEEPTASGAWSSTRARRCTRSTRPGEWLTGDYWDEMLVLPFAVDRAPPRSVAILGDAAGTTARAYGHFFPRARVDGVEIDGALTDVGRRLFDLRGPNLHTHTADARPFLRRSHRRWDVIVVDAYRQPYIPFYLTTKEFFAQVRDHLTPRGVVLVNVGHPERSGRLEKVLTATMGTAFATVLRDPVDADQRRARRRERGRVDRGAGRRDARAARAAAPRRGGGGRPARARACAGATSTPTTRRRWSGSSTSRSSRWRPRARASVPPMHGTRRSACAWRERPGGRPGDRARRRGGARPRAALRGQPLGRRQHARRGAPVHASVREALDGVDVLVDYTSVEAVKDNTLAAIAAGVGVVVGTSGLTAADFADIDAAARAALGRRGRRGQLLADRGDGSAAALLAARHLPQWEVIDYASATKPDVPSGTARELAERLGEVRAPALGHPIDDLHGPQEARGATVGGTQVHSVRLPSFVVSTEVVFGLPDERLTIRHDAGASPEPYVAGTLLAVRGVRGLVGLVRGLDTLLLRG